MPLAAARDSHRRPALEHLTSLGVCTFVWGVWAVMTMTLLTCIALFGRDVPQFEDWYMVAPLTGREPDLLAWLWAQNNEHRSPLPRLLYLALLWVSGGDFRVGMVCNTLAAALTAAALVAASRKTRSRMSLTDAFFPVALLHLGHWTNLIWSWQIQFVLSTCLFCVLLAVTAANQGAPLSGSRAAWVGAALAGC